MKIPCPKCGKPLTAPRERAGKKVRCASCGEAFVLELGPRRTTAPAPAPAPAAEPPVREAPPAVPAPAPAVPVPAEPPVESSSTRPPREYPKEVTVSRTMLKPISGLQGAPADAMICRLAPETFEWIDVSAAARAYLGEGLEHPFPATFLDAVHPDDRPLAVEEFRRAAEQGERHDLILRIRPEDGTWHFVRLDALARYDRDGGLLHHIRCHFVDVTDRVNEVKELRRRTEQLAAANEQLRLANERLREAQAQLVQSEKLAALGTLAAGMAHEINNPLAFATSNAAVLERDTAALLELLAAYREGRDAVVAAGPELGERIERLERQAELPYLQENLVGIARSTRRGLKRVAQIVANLREFARLDRSLLTEMNPNESLDQAIALLGEHITRAQIQVAKDYADVPTIECAAAAVNQVLFHLLMNAVQAVEDGGKGSGRIRVATRTEDHDVVIEIDDDGCGIPPEALPRIYDPFFTTKPVGRGTGLGLSMSHGIVADQGGRIEVESTPGVGSRFRIHLPIHRPARA